MNERLRRAFAVGQDRRLIARALRRGLLTQAQHDEAMAVDAEEGSPRALLLERGWLRADDLAALEDELAAEDFVRAPAPPADGAPPEVRAAARVPGRRVGTHVLVENLGRGGAGEVWKAWDEPLRRWVAVKLAFLPAGSASALERFHREAHAVARLDHPNILPVFQTGAVDGRPFIVMLLSEGRSLDRMQPTLPQALEIVRTAALAIQHAHDRGIVHRDVKPHNILVDAAGRVSVVDFGLAFLPDDPSRLTLPGTVIGTAAYMSPEQARGEPGATEPATDIYSLGATLYELVTGQPPFEADRYPALVLRVAEGTPTPPRRLRPGLGRDVETVILKAMAREPRHRYPTAAAFAEELRRLLEHEPISARPVGPMRRLALRVRRRPAVAALALVAALAAVGALAAGTIGTRRRTAALEGIRELGALSLEAALQLRRAGDNEGMQRLLPRLRAAYEVAARRAPELAEVDYFMARVLRAVMQDEPALAFAEKAIAKDPGYAPALYERAVLLSRAHGRERERLLERGRTLEASPVLAETSAPDRAAPEALDRAQPELARLRERVLRDCAALESALVAGSSPRVKGAMVLAARGLLAAHQGQRTEARAHLERAIALDPQLEEVWEALAQIALAEERHDDAVRAYGEGVARDRGYVPHRLGRSRVYMIRGSAHYSEPDRARADYAAAIADLDAALALDAHLAEAWLQRGLARTFSTYLASERGEDPLPGFAAADADLDRARRLAGESLELHQARGIVAQHRASYRWRRGGDPLPDFAAAEAAFGAVLALRPGDAWPRLWRGRTRVGRGLHRVLIGEDARADFSGAEEDLARATDARSPRAHAWEWLGFAAAERGRQLAARGEDPAAAWQVAEQALARAVEESAAPVWALIRRAELWTARAEFLAGRGMPAEAAFARAEADLTRALGLAPDLPGVRMRRGIVLAARALASPRGGLSLPPEVAQAEAEFTKALAIDPMDPQLLVERARLRLARARHWRSAGAVAKSAAEREAARRDLDQAVAANPHYARRRAELLGE